MLAVGGADASSVGSGRRRPRHPPRRRPPLVEARAGGADPSSWCMMTCRSRFLTDLLRRVSTLHPSPAQALQQARQSSHTDRTGQSPNLPADRGRRRPRDRRGPLVGATGLDGQWPIPDSRRRQPGFSPKPRLRSVVAHYLPQSIKPLHAHGCRPSHGWSVRLAENRVSDTPERSCAVLAHRHRIHAHPRGGGQLVGIEREATGDGRAVDVPAHYLRITLLEAEQVQLQGLPRRARADPAPIRRRARLHSARRGYGALGAFPAPARHETQAATQ